MYVSLIQYLHYSNVGRGLLPSRQFTSKRGNPCCHEPGSSVSIVSGYELDDREIEVRSPAEAKGFSSSLCLQTGSEVHPASCTMGSGGSFPRS
jgi:hypothetical protein